MKIQFTFNDNEGAELSAGGSVATAIGVFLEAIEEDFDLDAEKLNGLASDLHALKRRLTHEGYTVAHLDLPAFAGQGVIYAFRYE